MYIINLIAAWLSEVTATVSFTNCFFSNSDDKFTVQIIYLQTSEIENNPVSQVERLYSL